ncbi:MAG: hypothetical protein V3V08_19845 [Nannocystaceae bacterium]
MRQSIELVSADDPTEFRDARWLVVDEAALAEAVARLIVGQSAR